MAVPTANPDSLFERARLVIESFRPFIQADGGDVELLGVEEGIAHVRLRGACCGCPHAAMTLQMGIERHLRERVPEIKGVVNDPYPQAAPGHSDDQREEESGREDRLAPSRQDSSSSAAADSSE